MKTEPNLLSFAVYDRNIVRPAGNQTNFTGGYQVEQASLNQAFLDCIDTRKAYAITVDRCVSQWAVVGQVNESDQVTKGFHVSLGAQ